MRLMVKIAVTGGIGSGKSYVCRLLEKRGIPVYNCDNAAKRIIASSEKIKSDLIELVGENIYSCKGLNKTVLASFLLKSPYNTRKVNAIIHPAVADDFMASGFNWMECAILFSSGFNKLVDKVICVTSPKEVRIKRIMERDNITREQADEWINFQMPQEEIAALSDYMIINDGNMDLNNQIDLILESLGNYKKYRENI